MIGNFFSFIYGAPISKTEGIMASLKNFKIKPGNAIMIGDARADFQAAKNCGIKFLLRRTPENLISMPDYVGAFTYNFLEDEE
jgi:phosphoglycolate phosphatase-like HAD superfamily hydrolase